MLTTPPAANVHVCGCLPPCACCCSQAPLPIFPQPLGEHSRAGVAGGWGLQLGTHCQHACVYDALWPGLPAATAPAPTLAQGKTRRDPHRRLPAAVSRNLRGGHDVVAGILVLRHWHSTTAVLCAAAVHVATPALVDEITLQAYSLACPVSEMGLCRVACGASANLDVQPCLGL
jgi:hypothetical protein